MRVVVTLIAACLALPTPAPAADRFTDPRGDAAGGGPDVVAVTLSHTETALTIAVELAQAPPLGFEEGRSTDVLLVGIHTDDDLRPDDVEFYTGVHGVDLAQAQALVVRAGVESPQALAGRAGVDVDGRTVTFTVARTSLGDPEEVAVRAAAGRESVGDDSAAGGGDTAPDSGAFRHALDTSDGTTWVWPTSVVLAVVALVVLAAGANRRRGSLRRVPSAS